LEPAPRRRGLDVRGGVNDLKRLVAYWRPKRFFEYWGHEASLLSIDCQPLLRWRMARALRDRGVWRQLEPLAGEKRGEAEALQSEMAFYG
jgi:uncharacterized protein YcaQ